MLITAPSPSNSPTSAAPTNTPTLNPTTRMRTQNLTLNPTTRVPTYKHTNSKSYNYNAAIGKLYDLNYNDNSLIGDYDFSLCMMCPAGKHFFEDVEDA